MADYIGSDHSYITFSLKPGRPTRLKRGATR